MGATQVPCNSITSYYLYENIYDNTDYFQINYSVVAWNNFFAFHNISGMYIAFRDLYTGINKCKKSYHLVSNFIKNEEEESLQIPTLF